MKDVLDGGLFFLKELLFGFNFFLKLKDFLIFQLPTSTILWIRAISGYLCDFISHGDMSAGSWKFSNDTSDNLLFYP